MSKIDKKLQSINLAFKKIYGNNNGGRLKISLYHDSFHKGLLPKWVETLNMPQDFRFNHDDYLIVDTNNKTLEFHRGLKMSTVIKCSRIELEYLVEYLKNILRVGCVSLAERKYLMLKEQEKYSKIEEMTNSIYNEILGE